MVHAVLFVGCGASLVGSPLSVALVHRVQLGFFLVRPTIVSDDLLPGQGRPLVVLVPGLSAALIILCLVIEIRRSVLVGLVLRILLRHKLLLLYSLHKSNNGA